MLVAFEITHRCNKYCPHCSHKIKTSNYDYLTLEDYKILTLKILPKQITELRLIGGEPLMHPHFKELITSIKKDYTGIVISISTNGRLIPKFEKELENCIIYLTHYPGWNDDIIKKYKDKPNVIISNKSKFWDTDVKEPLSYSEGCTASSNCPFKSVRFVGLKQYDCCMAESIEREKLDQRVYLQIHNNWIGCRGFLPTAYACQWCFRAVSYIKKSSWDPPATLNHDSK